MCGQITRAVERDLLTRQQCDARSVDRRAVFGRSRNANCVEAFEGETNGVDDTVTADTRGHGGLPSEKLACSEDWCRGWRRFLLRCVGRRLGDLLAQHASQHEDP